MRTKFIAACLLLSMGLMASDDYTLQIDYKVNPGDPITTINVDNTNASDILGDGKMSYDAEHQVLQLAGVNLNGTIWYKKGTDDQDKLTIEVYGENILAVDNIESSGAIYAQVAELTIVEGGSMPAALRISRTNNTLPSAAITAGAAGAGKLILKNLSVGATSQSSNALNCSSLELEGMTTFVEVVGGDAFSAIKCDDSKITMKSGIKRVYCSTNSVLGRKNGYHQIFSAFYQEYDGVLIQGKKINNYTKDDIFQNDARDSWDDTKKILTLTKEYYTNNESYPFFKFTAPATLAFTGLDKNIQSDNYPVITTTANLTITGSPAVIMTTVSNDRSISIEPATEDVTLTFDGAHFQSITSSAYSIYKETSSAKANVVFKGTKVESMQNVQNLDGFTLTDCYFLSSDLHFLNGEIWDDAMSGPATSIEINLDPYPITVAGIDIYPFNKNDVLGYGFVSYDPENKVLTIIDNNDPYNADVYMYDQPAIEINNTDLTIQFIGDAVDVLSENSCAIRMLGDGHTLSLVSDKQFKWANIISGNISNLAAIEAEGNNIVFSGLGSFDVEDNYGSGTNCPVIKAKTVTVNAILYLLNDDATDTYDAIYASEGVFLHEFMQLEASYDVVLNTTTHQLEWKTASTNPIREVGFEMKALADGAQLKVMEIWANPFNASDILGDGTVSYNDLTSTLTLKNASLISTDYTTQPISFMSPMPLTIALQGKNVIQVLEMNAIYAENELTFKGDGKLNIEIDAQDGYYFAIYASEKLAVLDKAAVSASIVNAAQSAILITGTEQELEVDNADLRASVDNGIIAINCMKLVLGTDVALRHDDGVWKEVTWDGGSGFTGADLTHIWIGKNTDFPTDIENTFAPVEKATKIMLNGQMFILRGEHMYNMQGMMIR